jgi:protein-S-isoprenylcysteine O-methyltransferase Ste14
MDIPRAWVFFAANFIYFSTSTLILYKTNPELLNQRGELKQDAKTWDKVLMRVTNLVGLLVFPVVAGLDVGRYKWSSLNIYYVMVGLPMYIFSAVLITWAMVENRHFEATIRIQKDREHHVVSTGPYKIVRHPGYFSGALWYIAAPLIFGSIFAFIPVGIIMILFIIRTYLEDKTLQKELDGYIEYTKKVKYRLFPGIW